MPEKDRLKARRFWMVLGILLRSGLLIGLGLVGANGENELFRIAGYGFNLRNMIMFFGGLFLLYKAVKEIHHKLEGPDERIRSEEQAKQLRCADVADRARGCRVLFRQHRHGDRLGGQHVEIMIAAVVIAMIVMFFFANGISGFIEKHPALKMLALSFLVMVGFMLFFEGLEPIHHSEIPKGYAYVAMAFSFGVELLNMKAFDKYQKHSLLWHARLRPMSQREGVPIGLWTFLGFPMSFRRQQPT
jgi:predicted tellurium resistance membrane protein TerC